LNKVNFSEIADAEVADYLISKSIKPRGSRFVIILCKGGAALNLLRSAEKKRIAKAGYGFLLSQRATWFEVEGNTEEILKTGILYTAQTGTESAQNNGEKI
jgi:hypothetical protein